MDILLHPHAIERAHERGATVEEIELTVKNGEQFPAKFGRVAFHHTFGCNNFWKGKWYNFKQVEAIAVESEQGWLVLTVIVRFHL